MATLAPMLKQLLQLQSKPPQVLHQAAQARSSWKRHKTDVTPIFPINPPGFYILTLREELRSALCRRLPSILNSLVHPTLKINIGVWWE